MMAGEKNATDGSNALAANQCLVLKPKKRAFVPKRPPKPARKFWVAPTGEEFQNTINKMTTQLIGWMVEREKVAIKRNDFKLDWEEWSDDPIMLIFRFCNVRRECDRVTRAVIDNLKGLNENYISNPTNENAERIIVSLLVWRFVGSEAFVRRVGPIDSSLFEGEPGNPEEERVVRIMMEVSEATFCFTDAYRPAQFLRNVEKKYKKDPISRGNLYRSMFRRSTVGGAEEQFKSIHKMFQMDRLSIAAEKAREMVQVLKTKKSLASLGEILQSIPGMGKQTPFTFVEGSRNPLVKRMESSYGIPGHVLRKRVSGFGAKEVLQDLQLTPLAEYDNMVDKHEYCPIGPGAAKGIRMLLDDEIQPDEEILYKDMHHILRRLYKHVQERFPRKILGVPQKTITLHEVQSALCETSKYLCLAGTGKARHRRYQCADADEDTAKRVTLLFFKNIEYRRDAAFFDFGSEEKRADLFARVREDRPYDSELALANRAKAAERALQEKKRRSASRLATSVLRSRSLKEKNPKSIAKAAMRAASRVIGGRSSRSLSAKMERKWLEACASNGLSPSADPLDKHIFFVHYRRKAEQAHMRRVASSDASRWREFRSRSLEPLFDETGRLQEAKEEKERSRRTKSLPPYWDSLYHRALLQGRELRGRTKVFSYPSKRVSAIRILKEMYLPGSEELKEQRAKRAAYARERRMKKKEEQRMVGTTPPLPAPPVLSSSLSVQMGNNQYINQDGDVNQVMPMSSSVEEVGPSTKKKGGIESPVSKTTTAAKRKAEKRKDTESPVSKTTTAAKRKAEKRKEKRERKKAEERDRQNAEASCLLKDIMAVTEENEKRINSVLDMCESSSLYPSEVVHHNGVEPPIHGDFAPPIPGFVHPMPPPTPRSARDQHQPTPNMVSSHRDQHIFNSSIPKQYAIKAPTEVSTSMVLYKGPNCLLSDSFESITARAKKKRGAIVLPSEPDDEVRGMHEDSDKTQLTKLAHCAKKTRRRTRSTSGAENHMLVPVHQATGMNGNYGRPTSTYGHHVGGQDEAPSSRATSCWTPAPVPDHRGPQQDTNASIPMLALMNAPLEKKTKRKRRTRQHISAPPTMSHGFCLPMAGEPQPSSSPYYFPPSSSVAEEMSHDDISPSLHSTPITPSESSTNRVRRTKSRKKQQRLVVSAEHVCMTNNEFGMNGNTNRAEEMEALIVAHSDEHKYDGAESVTPKSRKSRASKKSKKSRAASSVVDESMRASGVEDGGEKEDEPIEKVYTEEEINEAMKKLWKLLKVRKIKESKHFSITDTAVKRRKIKLEENLKEEEEKLKQVLETSDTMTVERKELLTWVHAQRVKQKKSEIERDLENCVRCERRRERERAKRKRAKSREDKIKGTGTVEKEGRMRGGTGTTKTRRPRVSSPGNSKHKATHQTESTKSIKKASLSVDRKSSPERRAQRALASPERRAQRALASPERRTKREGEQIRALSVEPLPSLPPVEEKIKKPALVFKSDNSPKETKVVCGPLKRKERKTSAMRGKKDRLAKVFKPGNSPKKTKVVLSLKRDLRKAKVVLPLMKRVQRKASAMKEKRGRPMKVLKSDNSPKKTKCALSSKRGPDNSPKKTKFTLSSKRSPSKAKVVLPSKRVQRKASAMKEKSGRPMKVFKSDNSPKKTKEVKKNVAMKKKTKRSEEMKVFKPNNSTKTSAKEMKKRNDRNDTSSRRKTPKKENRPERKNGKEKKKLSPLVMKKGMKDNVNKMNGRNNRSSILRREATLSIRRDKGCRLKINRDQGSSPRSKKSSSSKSSMSRTSSARFALSGE